MEEKDETQTDTPLPEAVEIEPHSGHFDTSWHAKERAAIALFTTIEGLANQSGVTAGHVAGLVSSFTALNDSLNNSAKASPNMILPEASQVGTTLSPTDADRLEALESFYTSVRASLGLGTDESPPSPSMHGDLVFLKFVDVLATAKRVQGVLDSATADLEATRSMLAEARNECEKLRAANDQLVSYEAQTTAFRRMLEQLGFVITEEHAKLGIPPRFWLEAEESSKIAERYADLADTDRAKFASSVALVRQIVEHHKRTMSELDEVASGHVRRRQNCVIASKIRKLHDALAEANTSIEAWQKEGNAVRAALVLTLREDPAAAIRQLKADLKEAKQRAEQAERERANDAKENAGAHQRIKEIRAIAASAGFGDFVQTSDAVTAMAKELDTHKIWAAELGALLQDKAERYDGRTFRVDSHGGRKNALEALGTAANAIRNSRDNLAAQCDKLRNELAAAVTERRDARAKIAVMVDVMNGNGAEMDDPDITRLADLVQQLADVDKNLAGISKVPESAIPSVHEHRLAIIRGLREAHKTLDSVYNVLERAGIRTGLHANITSRIERLLADVGTVKADLLREQASHKACVDYLTNLETQRITLLRDVVGLTSTWKPGQIPDDAASLVVGVFQKNFGSSYFTLRTMIDRLLEIEGRAAKAFARTKIETAGTNELGAMLGITKDPVAKGQPVTADFLFELNKAEAPLAMNEGHETSREAIDDDAKRADMPNVFDCGCSRHKVAAGRCDVYDETGKERDVKPEN